MGVLDSDVRLEDPGLGGQSVNTKLGAKEADAEELWHRDGAGQEFAEMTSHLIVGEGSGGEVLQRIIHFELDEKNRHLSFVYDVTGSVMRSIARAVLGCYLVVLRRGEELEQEGVEGPIVVVFLCGEAIDKRELFCDRFGPRHVDVGSTKTNGGAFYTSQLFAFVCRGQSSAPAKHAAADRTGHDLSAT